MAGERIGRLYEALVFVSLQNALRNKPSLGPVTWGPPKGVLMVQPDISLGNISSPNAILLITRSGSRRDWHKKFWRNIGEIVDVRGQYPTARLINVSLGTEIKEELGEVLSLLVDINVFPERSIREELEAWVRTIEGKSPAQQSDLKDFVEKQLTIAPRRIQNIVNSIGASVVSVQASTTPLWGAVATRLQGRKVLAASVSAKWAPSLAVRRGLAKLLVFGEPSNVLSEIDSKLNITSRLGELLGQFGWGTKSISGWKVTDPEMIGVLRNFDRKHLAEILNRSSSEELRTICADVASEAWLKATSSFLEDHRDDLSDPSRLIPLLKLSTADSTLGLIKETPPAGIKGSWLFRALMGFIKCAAGLKQGYGYEQLIDDVRVMSRDIAATEGLLQFGASKEQIRKAGATDSLRRKLVDWVSGLQDVQLADWQIALIATVLARRLASIKPAKFKVTCGELPDYIRRLTYEDRIAPYRFFDPVRAVIELTLERERVDYQYQPRYRTLVSEASSSARDVGTTGVIQTGSTLINWQSSHGSHTGDKTKELCGRGFCLRYRLNSSGVPEQVATVNKLILVLDGDFSAKDVQHLVTAGWDNVFRPDQMNDLIGVLR